MFPYAYDDVNAVSSFNQPVVPPSSDVDDGEQVAVSLPVAWLPVVRGALSQLYLQTTWVGDEDTIELARSNAVLLVDRLNQSVTENVPTPYWDEDSEVDDEASADAQIWYGEVSDPTVAPTSLTFIENAAIWTFTGLLAVAGSVPAALAFNTIAPKFVISIRNGDLGNVIRLFVDGESAYTATDTGDGSVTDIPVVGDPSLSSHQIYLTVGSV